MTHGKGEVSATIVDTAAIAAAVQRAGFTPRLDPSDANR